MAKQKKKKKAFSMSAWMSEVYVPWVFVHRRAILAFFAAVVVAFLVLACFVEPVPFLTYTLFPSGSNFHDVLYALQTQFSPLNAPLYAYVIFGLDTEKPLAYDSAFKAYTFEPGYGLSTKDACNPSPIYLSIYLSIYHGHFGLLRLR